jgi:hypothetical protein
VLLASATPWQKAMLSGLSQNLGLKGEKRITAATAAHGRIKSEASSAEDDEIPESIDTEELSERFYATQAVLRKKFPGLKAPRRSARFLTAKRAAIAYLKTRPADVKVIAGAVKQWSAIGEQAPVREAKLWRFIRAARTIVLQKRLAQSGTPAQKAIFARLRTSESKNPLLP